MRVGIDGRLAGRGLGIATFIDGLARGLVERAEVVWFGDPALAPGGVADVQDLSRLPFPAFDGPLGRRLAARARLDVLHFTANTGWVRRGPVPTVLTIHDLIYLDSPVRGRSLRQVAGHRYLRRRVGRAGRAAAAVACPSQATATEVRARLRLGREPHVIPNGFPPPEAPDIARGDYAVVFSARDPRKGVELALEGWRAAGRYPSRLVVLAGAGTPPGFEQAARAELEAGEVELLPYLPREDLWSLMAGAGVLIHASEAEGFGLPVVEAMTAGTPVITGLAQASRELGGDAIMPIDPAAPVKSIAQSLARLRDEPALYAELARRGHETASRFSVERTAGEYLRVYEATAAGAA